MAARNVGAPSIANGNASAPSIYRGAVGKRRSIACASRLSVTKITARRISEK